MGRDAVIFTLDSLANLSTGKLHPRVKTALQTLREKKLRMGLVAISATGDIHKEHAIVEQTGLKDYFSIQVLHSLLQPAQALNLLKCKMRPVLNAELAIVDTVAERGIVWGNRQGLATILVDTDTHRVSDHPTTVNPIAYLRNFSALPQMLALL